MENYSEEEEEGSYEFSPYNSECEESSKTLPDKEDDYAAPPWPGDENLWSLDDFSSSDYEEEPDEVELEPEPPDRRSSSPNYVKSSKNTPQATTTTCRQPSIESYEDEYDVDYMRYTHEDFNPLRHEEKPKAHRAVPKQVYSTPRKQLPTRPAATMMNSNKGRGKKSKSLIFSGSSKEPEDYLRWETNMKQWLSENNIPKREKLSYAVDSLIGDAYKWWLKEDTPTFYHSNRVRDWGDLKSRMYKEFVKKQQTQSNHMTTSMYHTAPRSLKPAPKMLPSREHHFAYPQEQKRVFPKTMEKQPDTKQAVRAKEVQKKLFQTPMQTTQRLLEPQVTPSQGKFSKPFNSIDMKCYRCHLVGHFAVTCPTRRLLKSTSLGLKLDPSKTSLVQSDSEFSNSSVTHLSLSKGIETGNTKEPLIQEITAKVTAQNPDIEQQVNKKQEIVSIPRSEVVQSKISPSVLNNSMTVLMHLSFVKSVETIADTKEKLIEQPEVSTKEKELSDKIQNQGGVHVTAKHSLVSASFVSKVTIMKAESIQHTFLCTQVSKVQNLIQYWNNFLISHSLKYYVSEIPILSIIHLIFAKGVGNIAGTKEEPPDSDVQDHVRGRAGPMLPPPMEKNAGVVPIFQLKDEPPDAPRINKPSPYRGKTLDSQIRMKANLLSLSAGNQVLRSKPFEEGGYDAVIKPSTNHERDHMEQRQADETEESKSTLKGPNKSQVNKELEPRTNIGVPQVMMRWIKTSSRTVLFFLHCGFIPMGFPGKVLTRQQLVGAEEPKANCSRSYTTCITFSSHLESTSKWSHPIISSDEGGMDFSSQLNSNIPELDRCTLKGGFRPDQEEPSNEETRYGILTQNGSFESWNQVKRCLKTEDMIFTSQVNLNSPGLDLPALFGGLRPNHKELSYKPTWYVFFTHHRSSVNWIRTKPISDEEVIQFLNRNTLDLPYMESCGFGSLQSHIWRPGDILNQPETLQYSSTSAKTQSIIWIISRIKLLYVRPELPYSEPCEFNSQGIFPQLSRHEFKADSMHLDVPRHHSFAPKLSRLKPSHNLPYLARLLHKFTNGHIHLICTICFLF